MHTRVVVSGFEVGAGICAGAESRFDGRLYFCRLCVGEPDGGFVRKEEVDFNPNMATGTPMFRGVKLCAVFSNLRGQDFVNHSVNHRVGLVH